MSHKHSLHSFRLLLIGASTLIAAAVFAVVAPTSHAQRARAPEIGHVSAARAVHLPTGRLVANRISSTLRADFTVFRRRPPVLAKAADAKLAGSTEASYFQQVLPQLLADFQQPHMTAALGQYSLQNVEVVYTANGIPLLLLAGTTGVCIEEAVPSLLANGPESYGGTCEPTSVAASNGFVLSQFASTGASAMYGILPDGSDEVTGTTSTGQTVDAIVNGNAFYLRSSSTISSAKATSPSGTALSLRG